MNNEDYFVKNHYINDEMEMKGTLSGCYYKGHGRCARCPLLASAHLAGLLDHTRRTQSPSVRQPATSRHHLDTPVPVSSTFWPKYFFHFCTAIAMLKIKGSTYTRFKKLHMSEVPNAIRFRETFKVHWWIKDETALSFFHFLQALL